MIEPAAGLRMADLAPFMPFDAWAEDGQIHISIDAMGEHFTCSPQRARRMSSRLRLIAMEAERQGSEQVRGAA